MTQVSIEIKNVTHRYKAAGGESLHGVSLSVRSGETVLLCGSSGSGKTSVIRLVNGLIPHYYPGELTGEVWVKGLEVARTELYELAGVVGTVFQNPRSQFFSVDTGGEIVFGPENIGLDPREIRRRRDDVVRQMDLGALMGKSLFALSGGEKQRIACASVAALLPEIILLDEPSSNLDRAAIENLREIVRMWREQGKTILISEHRLWYLRDLVDRVVYMEGGRLEREWTGEDFFHLEEETIRAYRLRPTVLEDGISRPVGESGGAEPEPRNGILLKDFYFSYRPKPYLLWKKRFSPADGEELSLCVPRLFLPKGSVIGVVGRNGTGKSTFLRCVCGLERDCTGVIQADGRTYRGKHRLGFSYLVMQDVNHQLFTDSVEAEVLLSMGEKDRERCRRILDDLGLLEYRDTHPMALSGGQKQRVAIASALAAGARLLLFDEPTSGLDYAHMEKVGELLRQLAASGRTVLVSTHDPELLDLCCDRVLRIDRGRILSFGRRG